MNTMVFLLAMCPFFCMSQTTENHQEEITHHCVLDGEHGHDAVCSYAGILSLCTGPYEQGGYRAFLCSGCGFGSGGTKCVRCGQWVGSKGVPAKLCGSCGFGSGGTKCVRCGKWVGSKGVPAQLCSGCGFGSGATKCVRCGKWTR